jgi:uncharacterized phosphosugar-binding protein
MEQSLASEYRETIRSIMLRVLDDQSQQVGIASGLVGNSVLNGGIVHVFGAGHSQFVAGDSTFRAGGPAWANGILDPALSIFRGGIAATKSEQIRELADAIFAQEEPNPHDATIVVCNSGITPVSVRWAQLCRGLGLKVISIVSKPSLDFFSPSADHTIARYSDVIINNHCPVGDAGVKRTVNGQQISVGSTSSIMNILLIHWVFAGAQDVLSCAGKEVEAFRSGHMPDSQQFNSRLVQKYRGRIRVF